VNTTAPIEVDSPPEISGASFSSDSTTSSIANQPSLVIEPILKEIRDGIGELIHLGNVNNSDSVIKELHSQLQEARAGLHWKILKTALVDVVRLYDDLSVAAARPIETVEGFRSVLLELRQDVEDLLERNGFTAFTTSGDRFDGRLQQSVRSVETSDPNLAGTVAARLAPGFADDLKILRPEKVVVYKTSGPSSAKDPSVS